jgi:hypothetical protein
MRISILLLIVIFTIPFINAQIKMQVNTEELNVRVEPNNHSDIIGVLKKDDIVNTFGTTKGWTKIEYEGNNDLYVSSNYLSEIDDEQYESSEIKTKEKGGNGKFWASLIIVTCALIYLIYKIYSFFYINFGKSKGVPSKTSAVSKQKTIIDEKIFELRNFDSYGRFQIYNVEGKCISQGSLSSHEELLGFTEQFYITISPLDKIRTYDSYCKLLGTMKLGSHEKYHGCIGATFSTNIGNKRRIYDKHVKQISEVAIK